MVLIYNLIISTHIGYHTSNHHGKFTAYEQYWISRVKSLAFISYWTDISYLKWSFWLKCFEWPLMLQLFQLKQKSTSQDYKSSLSHFFLENLKIKSTLIHSTVLIHHHWVHRTRLKFNLLFHAFLFSFTKQFLYSNIWNCSRDLFYSEARDVLTDVWNDNIVCGFLVLNQLTWKIQNTGGRTF